MGKSVRISVAFLQFPKPDIDIVSIQPHSEIKLDSDFDKNSTLIFKVMKWKVIIAASRAFSTD